MANATTGPLSSAPRADDDALPQTDPVKNVLNDVRETAREQLNAAWQIEIERVQQQLAAGWRDTIVALRTRGELSDVIADVLGEASEQRFYLFPIPVHERVAAVLYTDSGSYGEDTAVTEALELMAVFASAVLEGQPETPDKSKLVRIATERPPAPTVALWFSLSKEEQELHLRAQRFARVQVAEMRLYKAQAVKAGRLERDLYGALREDVDRARDAFRKGYLSASPTMGDYVHLELLRTLANDDVELLGPEYPGAMA